VTEEPLPGADDRQPTADELAVTEINLAFWNSVEEGDLDKLGAIWADGPEVTCIHPGWPALRGRAEVLRSYALIMANTSYVQFFITEAEVRVEGDTAVLTCTANMLTAAEDEEDNDGLPGFVGGRAVATSVFRRTGDTWRLWLHHASPVMAESDPEDDL
jgi:ketosteroid isomerase-like protein